MAYDPGESFSSINTITVGGGIAWGTCLLAYRNLDFSREALDEAACYIGCNTDQEIFDQYCRLDHERRERIHLPRRTSTKSVRGISIGVSAGGALDLFDSIGDLVRPVFRELISNTVGMTGLTTGTAGGFMNMFDAGAFHGMNGHSDFSFNIDHFSELEYCMVQFGVGAFVSAGVNILLLGNFRNINYFVTNDQNPFEKIAGIASYLYNVMSFYQCYTLIGEASAGLILPGGAVNIVAT
jgi:hypothetical protein